MKSSRVPAQPINPASKAKRLNNHRQSMGSAKRTSSSLDARKLALYEQAYKLALASLRGYGWRAGGPARTEEVRTALSKSIVEKIVSGETDPKRIQKLALANVFLGESVGKR
jgi:hypothetical protein